MMPSADTVTLTRAGSAGATAAELTIPRELGPVRLIREIGRGGMGVVYLGRDQMLDRDVAVKFLSNVVPGTDDPEFTRFLEGARGRRWLCKRQRDYVGFKLGFATEKLPIVAVGSRAEPSLIIDYG